VERRGKKLAFFPPLTAGVGHSLHTEKNMSINVIFTCKSQPDKRVALTKILNQAKIDFPDNVQGCEAFRVFSDVNDPCTFTLVETWASETDHKKNIESMVASGVWGHIASHLACDPASSYFTEL
jgi:quinol monooxygenase YgiN